MSKRTTHYVEETSNLGSVREPFTIRAKNFRAARQAASRAKVFNGTCIKIYSEKGTLLAYRESGKKWQELF